MTTGKRCYSKQEAIVLIGFFLRGQRTQLPAVTAGLSRVSDLKLLSGEVGSFTSSSCPAFSLMETQSSWVPGARILLHQTNKWVRHLLISERCPRMEMTHSIWTLFHWNAKDWGEYEGDGELMKYTLKYHHSDIAIFHILSWVILLSKAT